MGKQSSVEWLVEEINKQKAWADPSKLEQIIQQAKAMHKDEIEVAYSESFRLRHKPYSTAVKYYNETFNNENTDTTT